MVKIKRNKKSNVFGLRKHRKFKQIIQLAHKQIEDECDDESIFSEPNIRKEINVRDQLHSWANCHRITSRAINDLLKILIMAGNIIFKKCYRKNPTFFL